MAKKDRTWGVTFPTKAFEKAINTMLSLFKRHFFITSFFDI